MDWSEELEKIKDPEKRKERLLEMINSGRIGVHIWGTIEEYHNNSLKIKVNHPLESYFNDKSLKQEVLYQISFHLAIHECPVLRSETEETH